MWQSQVLVLQTEHPSKNIKNRIRRIRNATDDFSSVSKIMETSEGRDGRNEALKGKPPWNQPKTTAKTKTQRQWEERNDRKLLTKKWELSKTMRRPFVEIEKKPFSGPVPPTTSSVELEQAPYFCRASSLLSYFRLSLSFLSVGELIKSASFPTLRWASLTLSLIPLLKKL